MTRVVLVPRFGAHFGALFGAPIFRIVRPFWIPQSRCWNGLDDLLRVSDQMWKLIFLFVCLHNLFIGQTRMGPSVLPQALPFFEVVAKHLKGKGKKKGKYRLHIGPYLAPVL